MCTRIALSALATALFLALFGLQLGTQHGPILKSYASTRSVYTPCSKEPKVCPSLEVVYSPGDKKAGTSFIGYHNEEVDWRDYYKQWDGLCDKQCDCTKTVQYSALLCFQHRLSVR